MSDSTLSPNDPQKLPAHSMKDLSIQADNAARRFVFHEHFMRLAENTRRSYELSAMTFAEFLLEQNVVAGDLMHDANAWEGLTFGIVETFKAWLLNRGDALGSIGIHLSHIKVFSELAMRSGVIDREEYALISTIRSTKSKDAQRLDEHRDITRIGSKKATPVTLTMVDAMKLKQQPDTAQGCRDRLIMCLLLDHGLRVSEVVRLRVDEFDLTDGTMRFYRPKVQKTQIHKLTPDTLDAVTTWLDKGYAPEAGKLLRRTFKDGSLGKPGITTRAVFGIVRRLAEQLDIIGLSPHDCRHYWTTYWAKKEDVNPFKLRQAGGWSSFRTVQKYVSDRRISNDGLTDIDENETDSLT